MADALGIERVFQQLGSIHYELGYHVYPMFNNLCKGLKIYSILDTPSPSFLVHKPLHSNVSEILLIHYFDTEPD